MSDPKIEGFQLKPGFRGMADDTGSDQTMFKGSLGQGNDVDLFIK